MSIDLNKLTPAPWTPHRYMQPASGNRYALLDPSCQSYCDSKTDMEFAALARNAFDVMMRRGWMPRRYRDGTFGVQNEFGDWPIELTGWKPKHQFSDPFTALVEADCWYTEHVEKVKETVS